jgi:hypothetical protein
MNAAVKATLVDALERRRLVRLYRATLEPGRHSAEGYVIGFDEDLVLVGVVDPAILLDGYRVLRTRDLTDATSGFASAGFIEKALKLRRQRPSYPEGIRLGSMRAVIESAAKQFPLITLHREREHKDSCWIGRLAQIDDLRVTIDYITPEATWDGQERYTLRTLTKVEFGGRYEEALASVGGAPDGSDAR